MKAYYVAHKEEKKAYDKAYNEAHKKEKAAVVKAYREAHKEELRARSSVYYESNKEVRSVYDKAYREVHKEETKAYKKIYNEAHKEEKKVSNRIWRKANPEKKRAGQARRRAKKAGTVSLPIRDNFKERLLEIWDNQCAYCRNFSDQWHLDHFMPLDLKGHHAEYNLVLACPPCNLSKNAKHPDVWLKEQNICFDFKPYMRLP